MKPKLTFTEYAAGHLLSHWAGVKFAAPDLIDLNIYAENFYHSKNIVGVTLQQLAIRKLLIKCGKDQREGKNRKRMTLYQVDIALLKPYIEKMENARAAGDMSRRSVITLAEHKRAQELEAKRKEHLIKTSLDHLHRVLDRTTRERLSA